jgi:hypothetical protein
MARTLAEAIKCLQQKPIFLGISVGVTRRRANNRCFIRREDTMTESVFAIALLQRSPFFNSKASKEMKGILTKNRYEAIAFTPSALFKIAKCHDPQFCAKREEILVLFNGQHTHSRDSFRRTFFAKSAILPKSNFLISVEAFNATFFLLITL